MPAPNKGARAGRKGHFSCDFCRARKLRCSRPLPCTNCASRGKKCVLEEDGDKPLTPASLVSAASDRSQQRLPPPPQQQPPPPEDLRAEIQKLRRLAEDLERRVSRGTEGPYGSFGSDDLLPPALAAPYSPASTHPPPTLTSASTPSVGLDPITSAVVTQLDYVSMGRGSYIEPPCSAHNDKSLAFSVERILDIPAAPAFTYNSADDRQQRAPTRCVHLPQHREAVLLVDMFLRHVSKIYHIVHHPSLHGTIRDLYDRMQRHERVPLGHVLLLLSIVASATHLWPSLDARGYEEVAAAESTGTVLFDSREQASQQTPLWIQSALHVLDAALCSPQPPTLEAIQGVVILSFIIANVEGVAFRYRRLVSTGLLLGRELGLHSLDHAIANTVTAAWNPIEREAGRRVWWYLASTDWLMAIRNSGPGVGVYQVHPHLMRVNEPRNINDVQLTADGDEPLELPIAQKTDMSYFLQRLRLAKIARSIVDRTPLVPAGSPSSQLLHAVASDAELDQALSDLPPFFRLESFCGDKAASGATADGGCDDDDDDSTFIQAYMLHSLIHSQRCKLHLSYLTSCRRYAGILASTDANQPNPVVYASSRAICLEAAHQIIRAETHLQRRVQHPFVQLRLSCILYGVFLASIVVLIDLCAAEQVDETQRADALQGLRIVADARSHSPAAAELYVSLTQLLAKHKPELLAEGEFPPTAPAVPDASAARPGSAGASPAAVPFASHETPYALSLGLNFDGVEDLNTFQWDDLLSGIDSSLFFQG